MSDLQRDLFQLTPTETSPTVPEIVMHPRKAQIERAESKADPVILDRYERVLRLIGQIRADFIAGDVTEYYESRYERLDQPHRKALGGVYQRLLKEGVIVKTGGYRARNQGNPSAIYSLSK